MLPSGSGEVPQEGAVRVSVGAAAENKAEPAKAPSCCHTPVKRQPASGTVKLLLVSGSTLASQRPLPYHSRAWPDLGRSDAQHVPLLSRDRLAPFQS